MDDSGDRTSLQQALRKYGPTQKCVSTGVILLGNVCSLTLFLNEHQHIPTTPFCRRNWKRLKSNREQRYVTNSGVEGTGLDIYTSVNSIYTFGF